MQIVDKSYFNKQNYIYIPLAVNEPNSPNNATEIDYLCVSLEREILLNALGLSIYNEIKALTEITIELPENEKFKKLIQGDEYDDKIWLGLDNNDSLIANCIFQQFVTDTDIKLSATGAKKVQGEKAVMQTPRYLIATAYQRFLNQYQGDYLEYPISYNGFVDWYSCDSIEKSLYGYMMDKKEDFPTWSPEKFRVYETKNSFGL